MAAGGAWAEEKGKDEAPVGPEPPRVVTPLPPQPPIPDPADPSWVQYRRGLELFAEKRFGEALDLFRKAIEIRSQRSDRAVASIDAAAAEKEAREAKGSIRILVERLAARDLIAAEIEGARAEAAGSLLREMSLIRAKRVSNVLDAFIKAARLVIEYRGLARVGDSLEALRSAATAMRYYPEAECAIARIYLAEGELGLAELQFRRSLDMAESLDVPEERYAILEDLASVYRAGGKTKDYEESLRQIVDDSALFSKKQEFLREAMVRTLKRDGVDKFMLLYRVEEAFVQKACADLGASYLGGGRPQAVTLLSVAVNIGLTQAIAVVREREPAYSYTGIGDLLSRMAADPRLSRHAAESGLYADMLLLGEALAADGAREAARGIWSALAALPAAAPWDVRAKAALARPAGAPGPYAPSPRP